jgi:hypothetical protein
MVLAVAGSIIYHSVENPESSLAGAASGFFFGPWF